jgi:outer membrane protein TolC
MQSLWLIALISAPSSTATRSLSLEEAVARALALEPAVAARRVDLGRTELALMRAELDRISVKVDATATEVWTKSGLGADDGSGPVIGGMNPPAGAIASLNASNQTLGLSNLSASVGLPLFAGFRLSAGIERAEQLHEAAASDLSSERRATAMAVARAYWTVRKLGLVTDVARAALERFRRASEIAQARVDAGLAPPLDHNRARAREALAEANVAELSGQLREAGAALAAQLQTSEVLIPTDAATLPLLELPPTEQLLERAASARTELSAASRRALAQRAAVRVAESAYYPELALSGLFQAGNNPFLAGSGARGVSASENPFANVRADVQLGLTLSINLFDTLHTHTAVRQANYELQQLDLEQRKTALRIEAEVRGAEAKILHRRSVMDRLGPAQDLVRDNLGIIQRRYESGEALIFELLDAERELLDVERQLAETSAELRLAWLELQAATGSIVGVEQ